MNEIFHIYRWRCSDIVSIHNPLTRVAIEVGIEDARQVSLLLSTSQLEQSCQSQFRGFTVSIVPFKEEYVLITQWEIFCNWFHLKSVEPIKSEFIGFTISIFPFNENMFWLRNKRYFVIGSIWRLWNQSNGSPTFSSSFVKDLCRGLISLCLDEWR